MSRLLGWAEWLLNFLGAFLVAVVLVAVCVQVVMRYAFNNATMWSDPVASAAMAWLTFVAMAAAVRSDSNMYVRFTWNWLGAGGRRVAEAFSLLLGVVFAVALAISAWQLIEVTKSTTVEGLPFDVSWATMYAITLVSALFIILFTIERLLILFVGERR
jgi:TRAP-type C4-dicarboxylate transport system permease small subunit